MINQKYTEKMFVSFLVIVLWIFFAMLGYALTRHFGVETPKAQKFILSPAAHTDAVQPANILFKEPRGYTAVVIPTASTAHRLVGNRSTVELLESNFTHSHFRAKRVRLAAAF